VPPNRPGLLRFRSGRGLTSQREPVPEGRPRQDPGHPDWRFCPRVHYFQFLRCMPHKEQKEGRWEFTAARFPTLGPAERRYHDPFAVVPGAAGVPPGQPGMMLDGKSTDIRASSPRT
jgi:hypothetical protein